MAHANITRYRVRLTTGEGTEKTYIVEGAFTKNQALEHFKWLQGQATYALVGRNVPLQKGQMMPQGEPMIEEMDVDGPPKKPMPAKAASMLPI